MVTCLRPQTLDQYVGQEQLKPLINGAVDKCNTSGKTFAHTLVFGPPGIGKTTLARCICNALHDYVFVSFTASKELTAPVLRQALLNLDVRGYADHGIWKPGAKKYFVFIDEVSELKLSTWESVLYNAMEDCEVHDEHGSLFWLPDWTLFAATTAPYSLPPPALSRFGFKLNLRPYDTSDLVTMIRRIYSGMKPDIAQEVAQRSRGIARLALNYAEGVTDHGLQYFDVAGITPDGLTDLDRSYLDALRSANGRGMSISSIANVVREAPRTLMTFVEPELLRLGLIAILPHQGRVLCDVGGRGPKSKEVI